MQLNEWRPESACDAATYSDIGLQGWACGVAYDAKIKGVCPRADCFAFGELLGKAPQVTKGACSWLGSSFVGVPSLRPRSVGPLPSAIHGGGQLSPHPCGSAHSTRPAFSLHPSRVWRCLDVLCTKIKSAFTQIKSFPAEAGPTVSAHPTGCTRLF